MSESPDLATDGAGFAAVLDLFPLGACVLDRDLRVRAWNRMLVDWTGIAREQAIGMDLSAARFPNLQADRFRSRLRQVFEEGVPVVYSSAIHRHPDPGPRSSRAARHTDGPGGACAAAPRRSSPWPC